MEQNITCFNEDIIELLASDKLQQIFPINASKNIIYIDPPYGGQSSDYPKLYSFLEEYIHMMPLDKIEKIQKYNRYAKKKGYEEQFVTFLNALHKLNLFDIWIISYNESSWKDISEIVGILKKYKNKIIIKKKEYQYNYRKNETEEIIRYDLNDNEYTDIINKGKKTGYEFLLICKNE